MGERKIILTEGQIAEISKRYWTAYQYMCDVASSVCETRPSFASPIEPNDDHRYIPTYKDPITILLAEGISMSFPVGKVISCIKKHFNLQDNRIKQAHDSINGEPTNTIMVYIPVNPNTIDKLSRAMAACGYYLMNPLTSLKIGREQWIQFEPKYDTSIVQGIKATERFLFHLTPETNVPKIKKNGIVPYSKNTIARFPERVYLLRGSTPDDDILDLYEMLAVTYNHKKERKTFKYAKVIVDVSKLPEDIKLFIDPNYPDYGLYTTDNVPPSAISDIRIMPLSDLFK